MSPADTTESDDILFDHPYIRQYKDGRVHRFRKLEFIAAGTDKLTGVTSKDIIIDNSSGVAVRLHIPGQHLAAENHPLKTKLPIIISFHGGAFVLGSAFDPFSHNYLTSMVSQADVIAVSVDYRLAPEHPLPTAYEDSWMTVKWVLSHSHGEGTEEWLNEHGDFNRVFLDGGSAGANIAHQMAMRFGAEGVRIEGMVLVHPYFWGVEAIGKESRDVEYRTKEENLWKFVCPGTVGADDARMNPVAEGAPSLAGVGCDRVLVAVAEKDWLRDRGVAYYEGLKRSGWNGEMVLFESEGEEHGFIVMDPQSDKSVELMKVIVDFVKGE